VTRRVRRPDDDDDDDDDDSYASGLTPSTS
jgi:hypothetical protein